MKPEGKPQAMPYYPVPDERLADALAGRLLASNESAPDKTAAEWLYHAGFAAGARWARELATGDDLGQLARANRQPLAPSTWLGGFIDGALTQPNDVAAAI